jgi:hypothetical protein
VGSEQGHRVTVVELLYFEGCRGRERLLPVVHQLSEERGVRLLERRIRTPDDAEAQRFLGSPTVRVDGVDVEPGAADRTDFGFKCRLYRTPESCCAQMPAEEWLREAIERTQT